MRSQKREPPSSAARWCVAAGGWGLPALVAVVVYLNTLSNPQIYDDKMTADHIPPLSLAVVLDRLKSSRGLTNIVHSVDKSLWGAWLPGFHLTNVLLHATASALASCAALALTRSRRAALLCGLFFAVHPVHTEVVASYAYRKDSLAMIFVLLALLLWLRERRRVLGYLGALLCLGLGMMCKEVAAIGLVPMLFLVDLLPGHGHPVAGRERLKRAALRAVPFLVLGGAAAGYILTSVSMEAPRHSIWHESNGLLSDYGDILATSLAAVPELGRLLVAPLTLSPDYPMRPQDGFGGPLVFLGIVILVGWSLLILRWMRRAPVASFAAAWIPVTYIPCSNVLPLTSFFVAERYLYVPSFGFCLLIAALIDRALLDQGEAAPRWRLPAVTAFAALLIVGGGVRSAMRNRDWSGEVRLWAASIRAGVDTGRIRGNLGLALLLDDRVGESIAHLRRAVELHPCTKWRLPLAVACYREGLLAESASECREVLELQPQHREARKLLEQIRLVSGSTDGAAMSLKRD